jgi:hypothetical protein
MPVLPASADNWWFILFDAAEMSVLLTPVAFIQLVSMAVTEVRFMGAMMVDMFVNLAGVTTIVRSTVEQLRSQSHRCLVNPSVAPLKVISSKQYCMLLS